MQMTSVMISDDDLSSLPAAYVNQRDLRDTKLWHDLTKHFNDLMSPAFGQISDAADPEMSPDGAKVAFTGSMKTEPDGTAQRRVCIVDTASGEMDVISNGPNDDWQPKWAADAKSLLFLSDRIEKAVFHLYILSLGELREAKVVRLPDGLTAEYATYSPTGEQILIGAAGQSADKPGGQGSGTLASGRDSKFPDWMPIVEPDAQKETGRSAWIYTVATGDLRQVSFQGKTVWESAWCGPRHVVAIVSSNPSESSWYDSTVNIADLQSGLDTVIYRSSVQLGLPCGSPSGSRIAFVEGLFSDRGVIAGTPVMIDRLTELAVKLDTAGVDVSDMSFVDDHLLFFIGLRGLHAVAGQIDLDSNQAKEIWTTPDSVGPRYPQASKLVNGEFAVARSSWTRYPEMAVVRQSSRTLVSLRQDGAEYLASVCGPIKEVNWSAKDGTKIEGFLCLPKSATKPYPMVLHVHGGPIWAFTNAWQMKYPWVPVLVAHGYAVLHVNPRGSKGRGDEFAEKVRGDMGGDGAADLLSGIDHLVDQGIIDTERVAVMGGSYGGFMAAWLITQTNRFAVSIPIAPVTDWFSQHTTSNIPKFDQIMLQADPYADRGHYYDRSPLRCVQDCSTPCLQLVGLEDRCTPASQAVQFHNALLEQGVDSVVVMYPGEGHGARKFPAVIDMCQRMLMWLEKFMPA